MLNDFSLKKKIKSNFILDNNIKRDNKFKSSSKIKKDIKASNLNCYLQFTKKKLIARTTIILNNQKHKLKCSSNPIKKGERKNFRKSKILKRHSNIEMIKEKQEKKIKEVIKNIKEKEKLLHRKNYRNKQFRSFDIKNQINYKDTINTISYMKRSLTQQIKNNLKKKSSTKLKTNNKITKSISIKNKINIKKNCSKILSSEIYKTQLNKNSFKSKVDVKKCITKEHSNQKFVNLRREGSIFNQLSINNQSTSINKFASIFKLTEKKFQNELKKKKFVDFLILMKKEKKDLKKFSSFLKKKFLHNENHLPLLKINKIPNYTIIDNDQKIMNSLFKNLNLNKTNKFEIPHNSLTFDKINNKSLKIQKNDKLSYKIQKY